MVSSRLAVSHDSPCCRPRHRATQTKNWVTSGQSWTKSAGTSRSLPMTIWKGLLAHSQSNQFFRLPSSATHLRSIQLWSPGVLVSTYAATDPRNIDHEPPLCLPAHELLLCPVTVFHELPGLPACFLPNWCDGRLPSTSEVAHVLVSSFGTDTGALLTFQFRKTGTYAASCLPRE